MTSTRKVLIITHDKVGRQMAGPGMRYHQIATELSKYLDVVLAAFRPGYVEPVERATYRTAYIEPNDFKRHFDAVDVIIALRLGPEMIKYAKATNKLLIFDLYAPVPVEDLVAKLFGDQIRPEDDYNYSVMLDTYRHALTAGDFFMTSNDIQRDFWTGFAFACGAATPTAYHEFPLYERMVLCPMGINLGELKAAGKSDPLRRGFPQIKKDDFVLVWTGGIWDWFDALTPIRALKRLEGKGITNVKLVFLGTRHPNPDIPVMAETEKAITLARELELEGQAVFFLDGWLAYSERLDYFLAANAALYAHKPSIEARFSHRTRVLDHFLAGLPTIATAGDHFADVIAQQRLGVTVRPDDDKAMADAIQSLLDKKTYQTMRQNVKAVQSQYTWEHTLQPLVQFLSEEHGARVAVRSSERLRALAGSSGLRYVKRLVPRSVKETIKRRA